MLESITYSENSINKLSHSGISSVANIIISEIDKLSTEEITAEGISAEDISELKRLHQEFKLNNQAPRQAVIERSSKTDKLRQLFNEASCLKKEVLDKLVSQFKRKDPEFYLKYNAAANVILRRSSRSASNGEEEIVIVTEDEN